MGAEASLLRVEGATFGYGDVKVVKGLDLVVRRGEVVAVCGANGAGKTTLVRGICGLARLFEGDVTFLDKVSDRRLSNLARLGLALIPDERAVIRSLTVEQNLRLAGGDPRLGLELFPELERLRGRRGGLLS